VPGAGLFPLVFQALGKGEEDLGPLPVPGLGGEARESVEASRWHAGCWGEDEAERTSGGRCAHTAGIAPANPVTDLTYIWGKGGGTSVAADGDLESLGLATLRFCRPLALRRERTGCPLAAEQPGSAPAAPAGRELSKAAAWHRGSRSPGVSQASVAGLGTPCPGPAALSSAGVHGQPRCSIRGALLALLTWLFWAQLPDLGQRDVGGHVPETVWGRRGLSHFHTL